MPRRIAVTLALMAGLAATGAMAQATRGLTVTRSSGIEVSGKTYALIIGISHYKNPGIPQLEYADRDAVAFRDYLALSGVDSANITLLTNDKALYADILMAIHELATEKTIKGDRVYIYFSGHGDVESKVMTQDGYLLPYDAPRVVYAISAINVRILQEYVSTMSAKGVEVILITDACHSGKLAGGIEGLQNIATVMEANWKSEIKFLSCQPGELSLENKQWGNGRGLFSYELVNGMAGMADRNKDGKVTLQELNLYLAEHVNDEAKPLEQNPVISGDMATVISRDNPAYLASLRTSHAGAYTALSLKGYDDALLQRLPDSIRHFYYCYKAMLDSNKLGENIKDTSAYFYYLKVPHTAGTKVIKAIMKRNLAAAFINQMAQDISTTVGNRSYLENGYTADYSTGGRNILPALLDEHEIKTLGLQPKLLYGQAMLTKDILCYPTREAMALLDSAVRIDAQASYASGFYAHALLLSKNYALSKKMALQTLAISPGFLNPSVDLVKDYLALNMPDSGIYYIRQMDNNDTMKFVRTYSFDSGAYITVPNLHKPEARLYAYAYLIKNNKDSTDHYFKKAYDTLYKEWAWATNADLLCGVGQYRRALGYDSLALDYWLARHDTNTIDHYDLTDDSLGIISAGGTHTTISNIYFSMACCYTGLHNSDSALICLRQSLDEAFKSYSMIYEHPQIHYYSNILIYGFGSVNHIPLSKSLDAIRDDARFVALMKKYFPGQYKD
jgi:hypothetical protein